MIRECCTQLRSLDVKVLCVFYLLENIALTLILNDMDIPRTKRFTVFPNDLNWVQY